MLNLNNNTHTQLFYSHFSGTSQVSRCQKKSPSGLYGAKPKQTHKKLEMWANAQRDGRPAAHRWRPLFNAAKFG